MEYEKKEICVKIITDKETIYSLWRNDTKKYAVNYKFGKIIYGMVGTELINPIINHDETIQTILKKFPEARKGKIKLNIVVVDSHEQKEMGNSADKKAGT